MRTNRRRKERAWAPAIRTHPVNRLRAFRCRIFFRFLTAVRRPKRINPLWSPNYYFHARNWRYTWIIRMIVRTKRTQRYQWATSTATKAHRAYQTSKRPYLCTSRMKKNLARKLLIWPRTRPFLLWRQLVASRTITISRGKRWRMSSSIKYPKHELLIIRSSRSSPLQRCS